MCFLQAMLLIVFATESFEVPTDPGLYYHSRNGFTKLEGYPVTLTRAGSRLASKATLGIKGRKVSAQLLGERAEHKVSSTPVFYYRAASGNETPGAAGDLVLVKLKRRRGRREFEVSSHGEWRGSAGISLRSQEEFHKKQVEAGVYRLVPARDLEPGEYGFYLFRGFDLPGLIYSFSVE